MVRNTLSFGVAFWLAAAVSVAAQGGGWDGAQSLVSAPAGAKAASSQPLARQSPQKAPSRGSIFMKSLLLPGWGQYSLRAKSSARNFLIAEITLWGAVAGFHIYGNWLKEDYIDFAAAHAGVVTAGKKQQFWVDIGNFDSVEDFNEEKLRQGNLAALRDADGPESWRWDSAENRRKFESLRIRSDRAYERSNFSVFAVVANHLVSAIHALWIWRKSTRGEALGRQNYRLVVEPAGRQGGRLRLQVAF